MQRIRTPIVMSFLVLLAGCVSHTEPGLPKTAAEAEPSTLDLREPMGLAAQAIARRLDAVEDYRPWFKLRGSGGIPVAPEHDIWDFGDMTGRYLEGLILARRMGVSSPELSFAEGRLGHYLLELLGADGLVHIPKTGAVDQPFCQGSALYGLVCWYEDSGDPAVRAATERLISGLLRRLERRGDQLVDPSAALPESSGSHLVGYQIYPVARFYELTGYPDALVLAEGLTRWALADPVLGPDGAIRKPLSWEGHIHSWLDTLAGCARTARQWKTHDRAPVIERCRAVYDWVRRSNATSFGWIATYPTGGSSETCAISSAMRLALELVAAGQPQYWNDIERFVRNQVVEAQFRDLSAYAGSPEPPTPLLRGCFDSQSMPNGHLGTRGGEDVGNVEGCCLNGGMRGLALAWNAIQTFDEGGLTVNLALSCDGPAGQVTGYQPFAGRVDVKARSPGFVRVRLPDWVKPAQVSVTVEGRPVPAIVQNNYVVLEAIRAGERVSVRYPLRELDEDVTAGGQLFRARWIGDVVVGMSPAGGREPTYRDRPRIASLRNLSNVPEVPEIPDTWELQDAARLASMSMLARMDLDRAGQPFFRIYPLATPPRAEHDKWDDGDMTGRYVEALILARRMTGIPMDPREVMLRDYLASLFDHKDGLCYTQGTDWTPRQADMFSQSSAMLGLLAWHRETGSARARELLDRQFEGLRQIAVDHGDYACFPKYGYDGSRFVDDPKDQDAPTWYGGRLILPLVQYWQLTGRTDVREFLAKLIRYSTEVSQGVRPDGEVVGAGWWSHLHSTMDMAAGIADFGGLTERSDLVAWAQRVYEWVGRTHTTRYGWVADTANSPVCESCAIASRIRLGLALYRAGAADPFGEIDRHIRNQLLENQFVDLDFLPPLHPETPRTAKTTYAGIDRMIRGTFQCWATANDRLGHDDIEGCGAGGGVQGLALAWQAQAEWRDTREGEELRLHFLFNRRVRGPTQGQDPITAGHPVALELWSRLPYEGRVTVLAHQPIARLALRLPDGVGATAEWLPVAGVIADKSAGSAWRPVRMEGAYAILPRLESGDRVELRFPLREYDTVETANKVEYRAHWRGSTVITLEPRGPKQPLYADRARLAGRPAPFSAPRYP